ncbi:GNAT family N-acetyltransferase [Kaistella palustris]|uniref:GNAT family N-acetyltransferase n=1 Tax=Kaistella palustris TaxID=493376 RepID=UPI000423C6F0|nr:GNAT family N-acetyltransferase [Kaistella palustris]
MPVVNPQYTFRKAISADRSAIWQVLQDAIERRKKDGSDQWQQGYPNPGTVANDIGNGWGYVLEINGKVAAYAAVIFDVEPAYEILEGKWLTQDEYVVIHRVAVGDQFAGKGLATQLFLNIENLASDKKLFSIRVDTKSDNLAMLKIFKNLNYTYCGEVYFHNSARKAFEKILGS